METVITRDTDILREYLVALDARERGLSPFARLAATVKLARLRRELDRVNLETTDEDVLSLRREVDERLNRSFVRRFESRPWGARISIFLTLVVGQQLALALVLLATLLFINLAPVPKWWNPALPREEPVFLYVFLFFFFFTTPMIALAVLFGGRYFRSWRRTLPATVIIVSLAVLGTWLVLRNNVNPVQRPSSLKQFAKNRGTTGDAYTQWLELESNALLKEPKFRRDYEQFLRNGPGRWILARFDSKEDAAWANALPTMSEYLDGGQDPNSFREWLKYYFDRNRIYSEDRIDQEVDSLTGSANQEFLGIWQVEPFLKERDERMYRAYLGTINKRMKIAGLALLALFTVIFLIIYLTGPALSFWERMSGRMRVRVKRSQPEGYEPEMVAAPPGRISRLREQYYSFPERREINTPPFFDTPFRLLSNVHRAFVRTAVFTAIFVFAFWALVYLADLAAGRENASSQVALMRSHLLFGGSPDREIEIPAGLMGAASADALQQNFNLSGLSDEDIRELALAAKANPRGREALVLAQLIELQRQLDEADYQNGKRFKEQDQIIASQRDELGQLRDLASQLEQTTGEFPDQLTAAGARAGAAEARAGEALGAISAATAKAESIEQQLTAKIGEVESRASRASEMVGKVEEQASVLDERTKALETELDRRAGQIEARTEELGERTAGLKEREERTARFQQITFTAIFANLQAQVEDLDTRSQTRSNKADMKREVDSLRQRISQLTTELRQINTEQSLQLVQQLEGLTKKLDEVDTRVKQ